ncbi:MFS transporter [Streptomyces sp. NBC_00820]|uniref:MFS transporter n=1 Tax=Streptomyces sp. NBC_00820 TaxID=2975842 RepID=UPI002ED2CF8C|nr:MFS transporter [Streptomyces sp. NBC_00820]
MVTDKPAVGLGSERMALFAVTLGVFCVLFEGFALNLALPRIGQDLDAQGPSLGWIVSAYLFSSGTLMLGAGRFADLFGRRRVLFLGLVTFGIASLLCAVSVSLPMLDHHGGRRPGRGVRRRGRRHRCRHREIDRHGGSADNRGRVPGFRIGTGCRVTRMEKRRHAIEHP